MAGLVVAVVVASVGAARASNAEISETDARGPFVGGFTWHSTSPLIGGGLHVAGTYEAAPAAQAGYSCELSDSVRVSDGEWAGTLMCTQDFESSAPGAGFPDESTGDAMFRTDDHSWALVGAVNGHPLQCEGVVDQDHYLFTVFNGEPYQERDIAGTCRIT